MLLRWWRSLARLRWAQNGLELGAHRGGEGEDADMLYEGKKTVILSDTGR